MSPLEQYERKVSQSDPRASEGGWARGPGLLGLKEEGARGLGSLASEERRD